MFPPEDAITTSTATIWLEDGIIISRANGQLTTAESAEEGFAAIEALAQGQRRPFLMDARDWPGVDIPSLAEGTARLALAFSAMAVLVGPESPPDLDMFAETFDQIPFPMRVSTDEAEALAFLQRFRPGE